MIANVVIDISNSQINRTFDYKVPQEMENILGYRVQVPFGAQGIKVGFVVSLSPNSILDNDKLKPIISVMDDYPILSDELLKLCQYMQMKFNLRLVDIIRLFIPAKLRNGQISDKHIDYLHLNYDLSDEQLASYITKRSKNRTLAIESLKNGRQQISYLNKTYGKNNIDFLISHNVGIVESDLLRVTPYKAVELKDESIKLNSEQLDAFKSINITDKVVTLLKGVTGSGKTEVYIHAIREVVKKGQSAIVLAPEISLTPQLIGRFRGVFGDAVAIQHSKLSDRERYDEWSRIKSGEARVIIGARSAVFAPANKLGLIIIDEEHDSSYVSDSNPRYDAHDIAIYRAKLSGGKVLMGSATPSLQSYYKAMKGEYNLAELKNRANNITLPKISVVDMSSELRAGNTGIFSRALIGAIKNCLDYRNQCIIFLNRRGYASFMMCPVCGYIAKCEDCDISLTYHESDNQLKCHYCNRRYAMPTKCPQCGNTHIKLGKTGTEKVVRELGKLFPQAKILRMDNDTTSKKDSYLNILNAFKNKEADIMVGTQMIAKGHNFPDVTLVGILDADMNLYFSDYRSSERTFQLVTQVAGRAGRAEKVGSVILQTYSPRHYALKYATDYDYDGFFKKELNIRQVTKYPPFSVIIRVLITSMDEVTCIDHTKAIFLQLKELAKCFKNEILYLQAMKSPVFRIEKKYRYQILLRVDNGIDDLITAKIYDITNQINYKNSTCWVEINPQSLT